MKNITKEQTLQLIDKIKAGNPFALSRMSDEEAIKQFWNSHNMFTYMDSLEMIDAAAREDRLYHHNGGQAYIRVSMDLNVLMIIDHTYNNRVNIQLMDGTEYFKECSGYNWSHSKRLREHSTTMVEWYTKHSQLVELDRV
jgi:hypothetical protein